MTHVSFQSRFVRSLKTRLLTHTLIPLTALAALLMWTTFDAVEGLLESRLEKEIELVARSLRIPVQQAFSEGDLDRVAESLGAVFEIDRVYGANVFDAAGQRVVVAGQARPGPREQIQAAELVQLGEELGSYDRLGDETVYSYFVPLIGTTGRIIGLLQVVRQESDMAEWLAEVRSRGWWLWGGMVALMLLLILFGHRRAIDRPVNALLESMGRIEAGERDHRAQVNGPKELVQIGHGLNRMLNAISEMEQQLAHRQQEHLEMAERLREQEGLAALGRFSAGVAHELGAPLTVIDGDARRLERDAQTDPEQQRRVKRIRQQVERTRQLIARLMSFVRSDRPVAEALALKPLLQRVMVGAEPQAEAASVRLSGTDMAPDLSIRGHAPRVEQALINLVRNAIQAADGQVRVSADSRDDGQVVISVEDDGPGVPESDLKQIFEPFHSRRREGDGTGLGLAIVRAVVNEHGARIKVDRSPDLGGARFRLCFQSPE